MVYRGLISGLWRPVRALRGRIQTCREGLIGLRGLFVLMFVLRLGAYAAAPGNDNFSAPSQITGLTSTVIGSNVGATKEPGEPNHAGDSGGHSVWWMWTAPPTNIVVSLDTIGSSFD